MTRRNILFINNDGRVFMTAEYNGDKSEFENRNSHDCCDKNWNEIIEEFEGVATLKEFKDADLKAQQYYHSAYGFEYLPISEVVGINEVVNDEVYLIEDGMVELISD